MAWGAATSQRTWARRRPVAEVLDAADGEEQHHEVRASSQNAAAGCGRRERPGVADRRDRGEQPGSDRDGAVIRAEHTALAADGPDSSCLLCGPWPRPADLGMRRHGRAGTRTGQLQQERPQVDPADRGDQRQRSGQRGADGVEGRGAPCGRPGDQPGYERRGIRGRQQSTHEHTADGRADPDVEEPPSSRRSCRASRPARTRSARTASPEVATSEHLPQAEVRPSPPTLRAGRRSTSRIHRIDRPPAAFGPLVGEGLRTRRAGW